MKWALRRIAWVGAALWAAGAGHGAVPRKALDAIRAVGPEGQGNPEAARAGAVLARLPVSDLPGILNAMDGSNDYALNWLRSAAESILQRAKSERTVVPVPRLREFLLDVRHHPRARRFAFEILRDADPAAARELLPRFRNDPSAEMRRDAVDQWVADATGAEPARAVPELRQALATARDADQVEAIAGRLDKLGQKVDLLETFGWVTRWKVVGPFDNTGGAGFTRAYPPEAAPTAEGSLDGKTGRVTWQDYATTNDHGLVDLNKPLGMLKEVAGYARAEFEVDRAQAAEIRLGTENGWKVWFNGRYLFGRDEYHRASEIDQYRLPVKLEQGRNVILVKLCQNEQMEDWAKGWEFQLRVTDPLGTPIRPVR